MEKADFHSDGIFSKFRSEPDIAERRSQLEGGEEIGLVFQSVYDRLPEYTKYFRAKAGQKYENTINSILDIANSDALASTMQTKKDVDASELKRKVESLRMTTTSRELLRLTELWDKGVHLIGPAYTHKVFQNAHDELLRDLDYFEMIKNAREQFANAIDGVLDTANNNYPGNIVRTKEDLDVPGMKGLLHIEGLNTVTTEEELLRLTQLWDKGIRSIGPIYGHEEIIGGGNNADEKIGLQPVGEKVILKAIQLGMGIDLAHCNRRTKDDIFNLLEKNDEKGNIAYTHGSLFDSTHPDMRQRAIEESQVREIIKQGGVIGISVTKPHVNSTEQIVEQIMTIAEMSNFDGVGIGTDFGGEPNAHLLPGMSSYRELYDTLANKLTDIPGVNDAELEKIFGKNIFSFARKMLPN